MQRRDINTVILCLVTVFIVLVAAVVIIFLRKDFTSNSKISDSSSSIGSVIQQLNNTSLLEHSNTSIDYPWTLSGDSTNKSDDTNKEQTISYHDGLISDFISITNIARRADITPIISTRSSNKCTDSDKSLMRFTLVTDNYPVR